MTRANYDDLKWHYANLAIGESFTVPARKIYEVYIYPSSGDFNMTVENTDWLYVPTNGQDVWYPTAFLPRFTTLDPLTQDWSCPNPQGWLFSEGEVLTGDKAFIVRWRDVTEQQLGS